MKMDLETDWDIATYYALIFTKMYLLPLKQKSADFPKPYKTFLYKMCASYFYTIVIKTKPNKRLVNQHLKRSHSWKRGGKMKVTHDARRSFRNTWMAFFICITQSLLKTTGEIPIRKESVNKMQTLTFLCLFWSIKVTQSHQSGKSQLV